MGMLLSPKEFSEMTGFSPSQTYRICHGREYYRAPVLKVGRRYKFVTSKVPEFIERLADEMVTIPGSGDCHDVEYLLSLGMSMEEIKSLNG